MKKERLELKILDRIENAADLQKSINLRLKPISLENIFYKICAKNVYEYKNTTLVLPRLSHDRLYKIKIKVSPKLTVSRYM